MAIDEHTRQQDRQAPSSRPHPVLEAQRHLIEWTTSAGKTRFFEPAAFPWARAIERSYPAIRRELDRAMEQRAAIPDMEKLLPRNEGLVDGRWRTLVFHFYGRRIDANCRRFPETSRALEAVPGLRSAMFSVLERGSHITPHHGPNKGVLRYHLGVRVPDPERCGLRVDGQVRRWREGKSLVFDDTFAHEAWNDGQEERVVLFVDFLRPLPTGLALLNRLIQAAARQDAQVRTAQAAATAGAL